jgi:hypothetical protein
MRRKHAVRVRVRLTLIGAEPASLRKKAMGENGVGFGVDLAPDRVSLALPAP